MLAVPSSRPELKSLPSGLNAHDQSSLSEPLQDAVGLPDAASNTITPCQPLPVFSEAKRLPSGLTITHRGPPAPGWFTRQRFRPFSSSKQKVRLSTHTAIRSPSRVCVTPPGHHSGGQPHLRWFPTIQVREAYPARRS